MIAPHRWRCVAVSAIAVLLVAGACSSGPDEATSPLIIPVTTTTVPAPAPTTTVIYAPDEVAPAPPPAPADAAPGQEDCHPAYQTCLANLPGDALNCEDLAAYEVPVAIWDAAYDPYRLGDGTTELACTTIAAEQPTPPPPPEEPAADAPPPTTTPRIVGTNLGTTAATPAPEEPPVEEPATTHVPSPQPAPGAPVDADPGSGGLPPPPQEPPPEEPPPDPQPPEEPPPDPPPTTTTTVFTDVNVEEEPCEDVPTTRGSGRLCLPPPTGDVVRLFACHLDGMAASPDFEEYVDSGLDDVPSAYITRTRPLRLAVGTRLEVYNTCRADSWQVNVVTGFGPVERFPLWSDEVVAVYSCGSGETDGHPMERGEYLFVAWVDPDGRYRLQYPISIMYVGPC